MIKLGEFDEYQQQAGSSAFYPGVGTYTLRGEHGTGLEPLAYLGLKLCGESGEVAEKIGKAIRDGVDDERAWSLGVAKELGNVLWYVSQIARELGYEFSHIAELNLTKLASRKERGTLSGSGDDR